MQGVLYPKAEKTWECFNSREGELKLDMSANEFLNDVHMGVWADTTLTNREVKRRLEQQVSKDYQS